MQFRILATDPGVYGEYVPNLPDIPFLHEHVAPRSVLNALYNFHEVLAQFRDHHDVPYFINSTSMIHNEMTESQRILSTNMGYLIHIILQCVTHYVPTFAVKAYICRIFNSEIPFCAMHKVEYPKLDAGTLLPVFNHKGYSLFGYSSLNVRYECITGNTDDELLAEIYGLPVWYNKDDDCTLGMHFNQLLITQWRRDVNLSKPASRSDNICAGNAHGRFYPVEVPAIFVNPRIIWAFGCAAIPFENIENCGRLKDFRPYYAAQHMRFLATQMLYNIGTYGDIYSVGNSICKQLWEVATEIPHMKIDELREITKHEYCNLYRDMQACLTSGILQIKR